MKESYPVTWLAEIAEVQRSSYYKWVNSIEDRELRKKQDQGLMNQMLSIHLQHKEYGYPRVVVALREEGYVVNHKKVYRLMKAMELERSGDILGRRALKYFRIWSTENLKKERKMKSW